MTPPFMLHVRTEETAMIPRILSAGVLATLTTAALAAHEPRDENAPPEPTYKVECAEGATSATQCKVDKETYVGWREYKANCQVCHGGGGMGSTFAPNLQERFNKEGVDWPRFYYVIEHGYTGQMGAMPPWDKNKRVMKMRANLYRYLKARADGKLPLGRPGRMK
ncbi:MAG: hypothetical protein D6786_05735 [Gammaproteobacteria bacterium]|nr:MAG: hypothetical protein D6786_05735 [Gammaproteobacteria bacterium]